MKTMFYICRKDNTTILKAYGYTFAFGGLGTFDTSTYQEVQGPLPSSYTVEDPNATTTTTTTNPVATAPVVGPVLGGLGLLGK